MFKNQKSKNIIVADNGHLKGCTTSMIDLEMYKFKDLNTGKISPKEYLMNVYIEEVF